jgi:uncharacterized protein YhaN
VFIERLHIDRFGIAQDQTLSDLSPGLCLFLGRNEAGKSTCLRFFRSMLFGYRRGNRNLDPAPRRGRNPAGGTLFLRARDGALLSLTRRPGPHGGALSLNGENGAPLDEGVLQQLLGGLTVEVFDNIFAFDLHNLMNLAALQGDGVRHALHGAAFGLGLRSPAQVLKELEERMGALLNRDSASSAASINQTARELAELRDEMRSRAPDMLLYTELQAELEALENRLQSAHRESVSQELSLRRVQRRLAVWQQWEEVQSIREERAALGEEDGGGRAGDAAEDASPVFAPDAIRRLDALLAQREERLAAEREAERACAQLRADMDSLLASSVLAGLYPALQDVREQKAARRDDAAHLARLEQECSELRVLQERTLAFLGPSWDRGRILAADVSLTSQESVSRHEKELAEKESALIRSRQEASRLSEELADCRHLEESALQALHDAGPEPSSLPDKQCADAVMLRLAQARAAAAELTGLRERAAAARREADEALGDLDPTWTPAELLLFDRSPTARQSLKDCGAAVVAARSGRREAQRSARLAGESAAAAAEKAELQERILAQYGDLPDAATLEARHNLLRRIERLSMELGSARREQDQADRAAAESEHRLSEKSGARALLRDPLFCLSLALFFLATAFIGAVAQADAAFFLCAGAGTALAAFAAGLTRAMSRAFRTADPGAHGDALRYVRTLAVSRRQSLLRELAAAAQAAPWLNASVPGEPVETDIERAMRLLETQGQKTALLEREQQELSRARQVLATAEEQHRRALEEEGAAGAVLESALESWRERVASLALSAALQPEAANGFCERAATAAARAAVALEAEKALDLAGEAIAGCLRAAADIPYFAAFLSAEQNSPGTPGKEQALLGDTPERDASARRGLTVLEAAVAAYRRCEEREQARRELRSVLKERTESRLRAERRLAGAREKAASAAAADAGARMLWRDWLSGFGLAVDLSPQSAREALEAMAAFSDRAKVLEGKQAMHAAVRDGLERFVEDVLLSAHAAGLPLPDGVEAAPASGATPLPIADGRDSTEQGRAAPEARLFFRRPAPALVPAALHLLGVLSARVEEAVLAKNRLAEKREQLDSRSRDLIRATTALELARDSLADLLAASGMPDAEHFRSACARFRKKEELRARERTLLAGIRSLAEEEGENAADLSASLERSNLESLRAEERLLREEIAGREGEMRDLSVARGQLLERRETLAAGGGKAPLLLREAVLLEKLHRLSRQWSVLALARDFLLTAKSRFEEEGQQGVIRYAGDIFSSITDGEYAGIAASLEGGAFTALHRSGDRRDPEKQLSQGAREQLYLALRLAYIKNHAVRAEPLPVIMDDILVNFDPVRSANTARVLAAFARDNQVLFFTCHPGTIDAFLHAAAGPDAAGPPPAVYTVDRGAIFPAKT